MSDWWANIERELDELGADAPDPWSEQADGDLTLTVEQVAFLELLDEWTPPAD